MFHYRTCYDPGSCFFLCVIDPTPPRLLILSATVMSNKRCLRIGLFDRICCLWIGGSAQTCSPPPFAASNN